MTKRTSEALGLRMRVIKVRNRLDVCMFVFLAAYVLCSDDDIPVPELPAYR